MSDENGNTDDECLEPSLVTLPSHLINLIVSFCDYNSLSSLSQCCHKLYSIINDDYVWFQKSLHSIVTNQRSQIIKSRSSILLKAKEKCKISKYWQKAHYKEDFLVTHRKRYLPWIQIESKYLWFSKGNSIYKYHRCPKSGRIKGKPIHCLSLQHEDVCRFIVKDLVFSGSRNGTVSVWNKNTGKCVIDYRNAHSLDINCVDCYKSQTLVSVSKDRCAKVWSLSTNLNNSRYDSRRVMTFEYEITLSDRIWCVVINESKQQFCIGTAGCSESAPFQLYDLQRGELIQEFGDEYRRGAGILHALCESENQLLSCGYDTCIRLWDTRVSECVLKFEDPYDSAVYCISSDHNMSILSGTSRHGLIRLWDKRFPKDSLQMYYVGRNNSPVYSLSFDPCFAYVALDHSINLLSFRNCNEKLLKQ